MSRSECPLAADLCGTEAGAVSTGGGQQPGHGVAALPYESARTYFVLLLLGGSQDPG